MNERQPRALALLAGHGAILIFAFSYYAHLTQTIEAPPMLPPLAGVFFILPAIISAVGVGVSYSALAASTSGNDKQWKALERMAVGLFVWIIVSAICGLYLSFTSLNPLAR